MTKRIKHYSFGAALSAVAFGLYGSAAIAADKELRIYNWSDYITEDAIANFEKETGISVVYDVFDSNELLFSKLLAGNSGYDLVVPSASFLGKQIDLGLFQKLDKSKLPNLTANSWKGIDERTAKYDKGNQYGATYMWGTTGFGYNVEMVRERLGEDAPTDSWDLVFKSEYLSKLADCGVYVLDAPQEIVPAAMHYLGLDGASQKEEDMEQGIKLLETIRPYVKKFHSSEYIDALANGDICLAVGWSGDVFIAADRAEEIGLGAEIAYTLPKEGALMWFDMMAIPADAKNVEEAHAFINYIYRPEVTAAISDYVSYANGNEAAIALIDPEVTGDPSIYPTPEILNNLYVTLPYSQEAERSVNRLWTRLKTGN